MDKEQEILAISRLVFDLTRIDGGNLDGMLARLNDLLASLPSIQVLPHSLILLRNSRDLLIQVAQFGLPPPWVCIEADTSPCHLAADDDDRVMLVADAGTTLPQPIQRELPAGAACFMLPLRDNGRLIGKALMFADPDWQPDAVEYEFMEDLAQALSVLVSRLIVNETLRVREVELEDARTDAIRRLGTASEYRDNETGMHIMRMTHIATAIAKAMDLPAEQRELLAICAPMHDVGKIGIPDAILLKPGRLLPEEYEVMKGHTCIGKRLLEGDDTLIQTARDIAVSHHEHWDGNGYPEGLAGEEIPLLARICAVSDVFDALTSRRPYKEPWPVDKAIAWVGENAGTQFDPQVVAGFMKALPEVRRIRELYRDDIIDPNQVLDLPELPPHDFEWVRWDDSLRIGIDVIDEHHRYLFDLTNDLYEVVSTRRGSREVARVMKALDQYVQVHFRAEERMMDFHAYPALDRQKDQHGEFEDRLREFYAELHDNPLTAQFDVLVYLRSWLVRHILHEDAKLRELVA